MDKILWCDHSNETSLAVLLHGTICFSTSYKMKFASFLFEILNFDCWLTLGSEIILRVQKSHQEQVSGQKRVRFEL